MVKTNTKLSKNDVGLLEQVIVQHGRIVTFKQLYGVLIRKYLSVQSIRNKISFLVKSGWLVRIKKGLYIVITDLTSLGFNDINGMIVAKFLNEQSYVSFENALQYYGMFDQMIDTVDAVTINRGRAYKMQNLEIRFEKIKKDLFFGFNQHRIDSELVNLALKEKAFLDMLHFRRNSYTVTLVWEKLKEYKNDIDFTVLKTYAVKFGVGMIRKIGFFLDRLGIDTKDLSGYLVKKTGYEKMFKDAKTFDPKWRIYFDDKLIV